MSPENLRWLTIGIVISLCGVACVMLIVYEQWSELVTAILGVAGFVLTWEVTKKDDKS